MADCSKKDNKGKRKTMKKKNILYISNEAALGGAAQSLIDMVKRLKEYINVIIIIPENGAIEEILKDLNIVYYIVPFVRGYGKIGNHSEQDIEQNYIDNYEAALKLIPIIKKEKIHLIHTNTSVSNIGAFAALMTKVPHVWHIRELLEEDFQAEFWDKPLKVFLMKQAAALITISDCVRDKYLNTYGLDSLRIYDGIDVNRFIKDVSIREDSEDVHSFILPGVISQGKGQLDAIKAVEILKHKGVKNIKLNIIGRGSRAYLWGLRCFIKHAELEEYVKIYPFQKDLSAFREKSDYAITSSRMEALGRVTLEAMLAGNIVIGANTGGTLEIIGNEQKRGYLYEQGNPQSLAMMMERAIEEVPMKKKERRKEAQNYVCGNFETSLYVEQILAVYDKILRENETKNKQEEQVLNSLRERYNKTNKSEKISCTLSKNTEKKYWNMFLVNNLWIEIHNKGKSVADYFKQNNIKTVAIYGMGYIGRNLYDELENQGIEIQYVLDRKAEELRDILKINNPDDELENVDAIVVTVVEQEKELIQRLKNCCTYLVIGISEVLNELAEW